MRTHTQDTVEQAEKVPLKRNTLFNKINLTHEWAVIDIQLIVLKFCSSFH